MHGPASLMRIFQCRFLPVFAVIAMALAFVLLVVAGVLR